MGDRPIKTYRAGNISGALWKNVKETNGTTTEFKTASIRRSWHDTEKEIWRDETISLRRQDIQKMMVVLNKLQEDMILSQEEQKDE